jgi:hypothetical protein
MTRNPTIFVRFGANQKKGEGARQQRALPKRGWDFFFFLPYYIW